MEIIFQLAVLIFSIMVHEISHGAVAFYLGDDTAKKLGRLTLDNNTCSYNVENLGGNSRRITISSSIKNIVTKTLISLTIDASAITINSWKEVADF